MDRRKHNLKQHKILQLKVKILEGNTHEGRKDWSNYGWKKELRDIEIHFWLVESEFHMGENEKKVEKLNQPEDVLNKTDRVIKRLDKTLRKTWRNKELKGKQKEYLKLWIPYFLYIYIYIYIYIYNLFKQTASCWCIFGHISFLKKTHQSHHNFGRSHFDNELTATDKLQDTNAEKKKHQ